MAKLCGAAALAAAAVALCVLALAPVHGVSAQSGATTVKVTGPQGEVKKGGDPIAFDVSVENAKNLGAFQFVLLYDDRVLKFDSAQQGEFLSSTGREVTCNDPTVDAGSVRYNCVSLRPTPAGPDGSGTIARILLAPKGAGTTDVTLDRVRLIAADEAGTATDDATLQNATISVKGESGMNWLLWGPIIGVAALAIAGGLGFAAMKLRGSSNSGKTATAM